MSPEAALALRLSVYAITDGRLHGLIDRAEAALRGGVTTIQLRLKGASTREVHAAAVDLRALCARHGALLIVNDRLDVALAAGADGVHLGPHDLPVAAARAAVPEGFLIGASAGTVEDALARQREGADYLGVGAIFDAHPSKADASAPRGLDHLATVTAAVDVPIVAIGGVTAETAPACRAAGAAGVAVIRGIFGQGSWGEVERAARRFGVGDGCR